MKLYIWNVWVIKFLSIWIDLILSLWSETHSSVKKFKHQKTSKNSNICLPSANVTSIANMGGGGDSAGSAFGQRKNIRKGMFRTVGQLYKVRPHWLL